jgi:hypothetical protein
MQLATKEDCIYVANNIRKADREEIKASSGEEPLTALLEGFKKSEVPISIYHKGKCVAIFGVVNFITSGGIWLLATDDLKLLTIPFLRENKEVVNFLNKKHKVLHNFVDCRNQVHIKWLKWLGFQFINKVEKYGVEKRPFYEFVRI